VAERDELPRPSEALVQLLQNSVLYEDGDLMVLNKPSGLASHGGTGVKLGLIEAVRQIWETPGLELAHRLDKGTSGCIVITRHLPANNHMTALFREHEVSKTYHALVAGDWPDKLAEVDAPLERQTPRSGERFVEVSEDGKPALTRFRVLKRGNAATLVEASPASGRTHQIRVHAQVSGHPIIGDEKYGQPEINKKWKQQGITGLCLHARQLSFAGPDGQVIVVTAPYDRDFEQALAVFEIRD
jgi:23S rRNA pseudouridine955/2504/2580 synthase